MNLTKLEKILSEQSGNKFCPICGTPFKPYHSRQKTCGSKECKKQYHSEYVNSYNRNLRRNNPELTRKRTRDSMRRFRAKKKNVNDIDEELGRQLEYWEKQERFDRKIAEYGDRYGEVQKQKILEQVPKIDVGTKGEQKDG